MSTATQPGTGPSPHVRLTPGQRPVLFKCSCVTRIPVPSFPHEKPRPSLPATAQKALCFGTSCRAPGRSNGWRRPLLPFEVMALSLTFPSDCRSRMDKRILRNWVQAKPMERSCHVPRGSGAAVKSAGEKWDRGPDPQESRHPALGAQPPEGSLRG